MLSPSPGKGQPDAAPRIYAVQLTANFINTAEWADPSHSPQQEGALHSGSWSLCSPLLCIKEEGATTLFLKVS